MFIVVKGSISPKGISPKIDLSLEISRVKNIETKWGKITECHLVQYLSCKNKRDSTFASLEWYCSYWFSFFMEKKNQESKFILSGSKLSGSY